MKFLDRQCINFIATYIVWNPGIRTKIKNFSSVTVRGCIQFSVPISVLLPDNGFDIFQFFSIFFDSGSEKSEIQVVSALLSTMVTITV